MKPNVLVVDDEDTIRKLLKSRLEREGETVEICASAQDGETALTQGKDFGVIITDLRMPGKDGFQFMDWIQSKSIRSKVIVITGHGEKEIAIRCLRHGATDYLEKPFDLDELVHAVKRAQREYRLEKENQDFVDGLKTRVERAEGKSSEAFWYESKDPSMGQVNEWLSVLRRESARTDAEEPSVLILGESGTGKEGVARLVHKQSRRAKGPWVAVNCANLSEQLLESELFGHEKGSFTGANTLKKGLFEVAKGGTLFLDELGEMDVKLQARLLRVLQEKTFRRVGGTEDLTTDVRVITATNVDLQRKIKDGKFREDLYHRLNRVMMQLPPLRDRKSDLLAMAKQFAVRAYQGRAKNFPGFMPDAEDAIAHYVWAGNVREMVNVMERLALLDAAVGPVPLRALSLPPAPFKNSSGQSRFQLVSSQATTGAGTAQTDTNGAPSTQVNPEEVVQGQSYIEAKKRWSDAFEKEYLCSVLKKHDGNVSAASRESQMDRSNFLRLLRRHGVRSESFRKVGSSQAA